MVTKKLLRFGHKLISPTMWNKVGMGLKASVTISFDVEGEEDTAVLPQLLALLQKHNIKASFACVGTQIELHPEIYKQILAEGHEIINHSYSHRNSITKDDIAKCQDVCVSLLNYEPKGFRTPHFAKLHNERIYYWLQELGMKYSSSVSFAKEQAIYSVMGITELPVITCPEHYYSVMDSCHLLKTKAHQPKEMKKLFEKVLDITDRNNLAAIFYFDPSHIVNVPEFEQCLELISKQKVLIKKCEELL